MNDSRAILWIRNDQRIQDNKALTAAIADNESILPVFVIDNRLFEKTDLGLERASNRRLNFLGDSLLDLKKSYKNIGGDILCLKGNVAESIIDLAQKYDIKKVYATLDYATEEFEDEQQVSNAGLDLQLYDQGSLVRLKQLPFTIEQAPDVFTIFRKKAEAKCDYLPAINAPKQLNCIKEVDYEQSEANINKWLRPSFETSTKGIVLNGGSSEANKRLQHYFWETKAVAHYKETRNQLLGWDYSSKFSAWLSVGNISARMIQDELQRFEKQVVKNENTYWLTFELLWRDYFKFMSLKYGRKLFLENGFKNVSRFEEEFVWSTDHHQSLENWMTGNTNMPFVDANMRELIETGFMSNRGRQVVASYLVHDLGLPWILGAKFFEHHLLDYDACSNYANWQYVAGVGNDPRPNRYFNTVSQAQRYDPNGDFVKHWLPKLSGLSPKELLEPWVHRPEQFPKPTSKAKVA
jgi:deoxyribodipyrimidine photo-lyase